MKKLFNSRFVRFASVSLLLIYFVSPSIALAATTVNAPTLDSTATVSVAPSATITLVVSVTTTSSDDWESTSYRIGSSGSFVCIDTNNHSSSGTYSESFNITAPSIAGSYNLEIRTFANNSSYSTNNRFY